MWRVLVAAVAMLVEIALALVFLGHQCQSTPAQRDTSRFSNATGSPLCNVSTVADLQQVAMANYSRCLTPGCIKAAAQIIENMDPTMDPCTDFYQFACGNFMQAQKIADDKSYVAQFSIAQDELDAKLRSVLEKPVDPNKDQPHVISLKNHYQSCMNIGLLDELGEEPLLKVLRELGGWPVLEGPNWNATSFDWMQTIFALRNLGFSHNTIFKLRVMPNFRNKAEHLIDLDQATLGLPNRDYYVEHMTGPVVSAYLKLMTGAASLLGANNTSEVKQELEDALSFEADLAIASLSLEQRGGGGSIFNTMPLSELKKLSPTIDWDLYFNSLLVDPVGNDEMINVGVPNFIVQVANLLQTVDKRALANYMMWRVVYEAYQYLGQVSRDQLVEFYAVLLGQSSETPRWQLCLEKLTEKLGISLANVYVKNFFDEDSKNHALSMVKYIMNEFVNIIEEVDWMDNSTRQNTKDKAEAMVPYIGYPPELLNDTLINDHYTNLSMKPDEFFLNALKLTRWSRDNSLGKLRKTRVKGDWKKRAKVAVINAYYSSLENYIHFPAGILQGAFFSKDRPKYMNFGAIGYIIGHEITHGFDDRGRMFDKDGNNKNWWKHETDEKFKKKAQCIIHQYGNYTIPAINMTINGINTQGENIADNGGIKEAFRAYRQWVKDNGPESALPGLNYTPDQLFWISAANVWCGKYRPQALLLSAIAGWHSPSMYRVIGPLSNTVEFSEQFNCPIGSPMNPRDKCTVW